SWAVLPHLDQALHMLGLKAVHPHLVKAQGVQPVGDERQDPFPRRSGRMAAVSVHSAELLEFRVPRPHRKVLRQACVAGSG
ncbi:MAG: hypothetical protein ACREBC_25190, partial [Pyrinomonadaceae bacterium]